MRFGAGSACRLLAITSLPFASLACAARPQPAQLEASFVQHAEAIHVLTAEALAIELDVSITCRPVPSELHALEAEAGAAYYDRLVVPEARAAASEVAGRTNFFDFMREHDAFEAALGAELRRRLEGKHVELAALTLESVISPPEIAAAVKAHLLAEQAKLLAQTDAGR